MDPILIVRVLMVRKVSRGLNGAIQDIHIADIHSLLQQRLAECREKLVL